MKRQPRLYSLFEKQPDGKYKRISELAYTKPVAVRVFQSALLAPSLGTQPLLPRELRPVAKATDNAACQG